MLQPLPYCGSPPDPGELLHRFNLDPRLMAALLLLSVAHIAWLARPGTRRYAAMGWTVTAFALMSPLCALSVALFSARIAQHMLLILVGAPLVALALPSPRGESPRLPWIYAGVFFVLLWFWHMPAPYDATFASTPVYWAMHISLFASAVLLWRELLQHRVDGTVEALAIGAVTSMQMGLLGAVLALASHPLFSWHLTTTAAWHLTTLQDQQLGGTIMWVPGVALFLWAAMRSVSRLVVSPRKATRA